MAEYIGVYNKLKQPDEELNAVDRVSLTALIGATLQRIASLEDKLKDKDALINAEKALVDAKEKLLKMKEVCRTP